MNSYIESQRKRMWSAYSLTQVSDEEVASGRYKENSSYKNVGFQGEVHFMRSNVASGLVGITDKEIVIAFKGTDSFNDVLTDLTAVQIPFPPEYGGGKVHLGFYDSLNSIYSDLLRKVRDLSSTNAKLPIFVTGHSKGGALAILMARMILTDINPSAPIYVCTFAAPRVGDATFKNGYKSLEGNHNRYECPLDIVPHLPLTKPEYQLFKRLSPYYDNSYPILPQIIVTLFWFFENFEQYAAVGEYCYVPPKLSDDSTQATLNKYGKYPIDTDSSTGETLNSLCAVEQMIRCEVFSTEIFNTFDLLNAKIHNDVYRYYNR